MRKLIFPLAFIGVSSLVACSFQMQAGSDPKKPQQQPAQPQAANKPAPAQTTPQPAYTAAGGPSRKIGRRTSGPSGPTPAPSNSTTPPTPPTPPAPTGAPIVSAATIFGGGTPDTAGFKGSIYWVPAGTTTMPAFASAQPNGFLFTKEINVTPQAFTSGFPGVDAAHKDNFAIRYEAPLVVGAEADYDFRIVSDDGAVVAIDGMTIVDNNGVRTAPAEKTGPVHLVVGTHMITVDYLQTTGNVALQLFCKKANDAEKVCPTQLQ